MKEPYDETKGWDLLLRSGDYVIRESPTGDLRWFEVKKVGKTEIEIDGGLLQPRERCMIDTIKMLVKAVGDIHNITGHSRSITSTSEVHFITSKALGILLRVPMNTISGMVIS